MQSRETGLILPKAAAMRIDANLEPAYLSPPLCPASFCASPNVSVYYKTVRGYWQMRIQGLLLLLVLLIMNFASPAVEINLLGARLVLQGSCAFLALMMNICLYFIQLDVRLR